MNPIMQKALAIDLSGSYDSLSTREVTMDRSGNGPDSEILRVIAAAERMARKLNLKIDIDPEKARMVRLSGDVQPISSTKSRTKRSGLIAV